jgi:hypothetical protein
MGKREVFAGVFVILVLAGVIIGARKARNTPKVPAATPSPEAVEKIKKAFNFTIPSDVEKADLKKVGNIDGIGIATRKFQNGKFEFMVLVDLPVIQTGKPYEVWLEKTGGDKFFLGNLRLAKGGYLLEFESGTDYSDYGKVRIVQERDILEGSF